MTPIGAAQDHVQLLPRGFESVEQAEVELAKARAMYEQLKRENAGHGPVRTAECVVFGAEEVVTMAHAQNDGKLTPVQNAYLSAEVQVLRVDDVFLVGLPGELFVEYALEIKQRSLPRVFISSLANGELQGYITTSAAVGYEANLSMFKPESGTIMVETALRVIDKVGE